MVQQKISEKGKKNAIKNQQSLKTCSWPGSGSGFRSGSLCYRADTGSGFASKSNGLFSFYFVFCGNYNFP